MMAYGREKSQSEAGAILLALSVVLGVEPMANGVALADQPPPELKMILAPGSADSGVITFSAEDGQAPVRKTAPPEPMTVLPPEATAESARQRAALVSGDGRPTSLEYTNSLTLGVGYRWDDLSWNIADIDGHPNILSELQYDDFQSMTLSATLRWSNSSNIYVRGGVDIGRALSGDVRDSDYLGDNRTMEFSRSSADGDGGALLDADIGVGYRFDVPISGRETYMQLMPLLGYSYHSQELEMSDGRQEISAYGWGMPLGSFDGLDSNYDAHWAGPWIGVDMELAFNRRHALMASVEYHWVDYEGDADWNLRTDFAHPVSFEHDSDGDGVVASITYRYTPDPKWFWTLGFKYSKFETDSGTDTTYFSDGTVASVPLNEVERESCAVMVGLGYRF